MLHLVVKFRHTQGFAVLKQLFSVFDTFYMFLSTPNFKDFKCFTISWSAKEKQPGFLFSKLETFREIRMSYLSSMPIRCSMLAFL